MTADLKNSVNCNLLKSYSCLQQNQVLTVCTQTALPELVYQKSLIILL